jgi:thioredoxin 1
MLCRHIGALGLLVCCGAAAAEGPFRDVSLQDARKEAAKEHRVVVALCCASWCRESRMLEDYLQSEDEVVSFLRDKAVAVRVDLDKDPFTALRYGVQASPTILFIKADGTELDRIIGFIDSAQFLEDATLIAEGRNVLELAAQQVKDTEGKDPLVRLHYARALTRRGRLPEALPHLLWCFDEGWKHGVAFGPAGRAAVLEEIIVLGQVYEPAIAALRERRDVLHDAIANAKAAPGDEGVLVDLNAVLGEEQRTLNLYDELRRQSPDSQVVARLREAAFDLLLEEKRYEEILAGMDFEAKVEEAFREAEQAGEAEANLSAAQMEQFRAYGRRRALYVASSYYQVLIGVGKNEQAAGLAERVLRFDASAETYNALAWAGYLTGKPIKENLAQARKAHELSGGKSAAIIDTLARVLDKLGHKDEARTLVEGAIRRLESADDRSMLNQTRVDLMRAGPSQ